VGFEALKRSELNRKLSFAFCLRKAFEHTEVAS
jgi:hypothetical protein